MPGLTQDTAVFFIPNAFGRMGQQLRQLKFTNLPCRVAGIYDASMEDCTLGNKHLNSSRVTG
jgi:hypothetical protein